MKRYPYTAIEVTDLINLIHEGLSEIEYMIENYGSYSCDELNKMRYHLSKHYNKIEVKLREAWNEFKRIFGE